MFSGSEVFVVLASLNMVFLPKPRSSFKQRQIPLFETVTNVLQFCVYFGVILGHFGKEIFFFSKDRLN